MGYVFIYPQEECVFHTSKYYSVCTCVCMYVCVYVCTCICACIPSTKPSRMAHMQSMLNTYL